jgi:hypothetical protein
VASPVELLYQISIFAMLSMAVAVGAFLVSVYYVVRPTERTLTLMRPVSLAAIFSALCGVLSGSAMVLTGLAATAPGQVNLSAVYMGMAEVLTLGFVCFGFLAAAWLLVGVGMLRRTQI